MGSCRSPYHAAPLVPGEIDFFKRTAVTLGVLVSKRCVPRGARRPGGGDMGVLQRLMRMAVSTEAFKHQNTHYLLGSWVLSE